MNIIKSAILMMALLSTSAFAEQPTTLIIGSKAVNQDQMFPAFAGVETSPVSDEELHQVSGEGLGFGTLGLAYKLTKAQFTKVLCGRRCVRT